MKIYIFHVEILRNWEYETLTITIRGAESCKDAYRKAIDQAPNYFCSISLFDSYQE